MDFWLSVHSRCLRCCFWGEAASRQPQEMMPVAFCVLGLTQGPWSTQCHPTGGKKAIMSKDRQGAFESYGTRELELLGPPL